MKHVKLFLDAMLLDGQLHKMLLELHKNLTKVDFKEKWHNGKGYFDGALEEPVLTPCASTCPDPDSRRIVLIPCGRRTAVMFERYSPSENSTTCIFQGPHILGRGWSVLNTGSDEGCARIAIVLATLLRDRPWDEDERQFLATYLGEFYKDDAGKVMANEEMTKLLRLNIRSVA